MIFFSFIDLEYVVQEKVHGANTSFLCDGNEVKFAKRTSVLAEDENFLTKAARSLPPGGFLLQYHVFLWLEVVLHAPYVRLAVPHAEHLKEGEERLVALLCPPWLEELA